MKLIPITNATSCKPDKMSAKNRRYEFSRRLMIETMKPLQPLLRDLNTDPDDSTLYELVLKENTRRALDRCAEEIDYSRLLVSKGKLPMPARIAVISHRPGELHFTWNDNSGRRRAYWTDHLFVALFHLSSGRWIFNLDEGIRANCKCNIDAFSLESQMVHVYAGFVSKKNSLVSTSAYLGAIQIKSMGLGYRA